MRTLWSTNGKRWYRVRLYSVGPRGGHSQLSFTSLRADSKGEAIGKAEADYVSRLAASVERE